MRGVELFVIGDSCTRFWNGSGNDGVPDSVPGVRTLCIPGATAYSLLSETSRTQARTLVLSGVRQAIIEEFSGWLMLYFGSNDCNAWIWRQVPRITLAEAVRDVVDRYVRFLHEVREIYPTIAVFAPPAATKIRNIGTEVERNLAVLLFESMLHDRLDPHGIPVISMARAMIAPDGATISSFYCEDLLHPRQSLFPYAAQLVNAALGLKITVLDNPLNMREMRIERFCAITPSEGAHRPGLHWHIADGVKYVTELGIWPQTFRALGPLEIVFRLAGGDERYVHLSPPDDTWPLAKKYYVPLGYHAREIIIRPERRLITPNDVAFYAYSSQMSAYQEYSVASLFALHDQLLAKATRRPTLWEEVDLRSEMEVAGLC